MTSDQTSNPVGTPIKPVPNPLSGPPTIQPDNIPTYEAKCRLCGQQSNGSILYHMANRHAYSLERAAAYYGTIDVEVFKYRLRDLQFTPGTEEFHFMKEFIESNSSKTELLPSLTKMQRLGDTNVANECDNRQEEYIPSDWYRNTEEYRREREQIEAERNNQ